MTKIVIINPGRCNFEKSGLVNGYTLCSICIIRLCMGGSIKKNKCCKYPDN
jgi:hypothetical protein